MRQFVLLIALAITLVGCVTTPPPVIRGQEMAIEAVSKVEVDVLNLIDAYNIEVKALVAQKYANEFLLTEAKLLAERNNDGTVDLVRYKQYQAEFAVELQKSDEFYDNLAMQWKAQVGYKFGVAKNMALAVQVYNKAAGVDPETFDQLLAGTSELATIAIDKYGAAQAADAAQPQKADWKSILRMAAQTDPAKLPMFGDPNSAWRKFTETGQKPKLQDIVSGIVANTRAAQQLFATPPSSATPLEDIQTPATPPVVTVTPSN